VFSANFTFANHRALTVEPVELSPTEFNTIFESSGDVSNGQGETMFVGNTGRGDAMRTLIRFGNLENKIPPEGVIQTVSLYMYMDRTKAGATQVTLHRLLKSWGQGNSTATGGGGAPATPNSATWTYRFYPDILWTSEGGDFNETVCVSTQVNSAGSYYIWSSVDMVNDVQEWIAKPSSNFGWIVMGEEDRSTTAKRFASPNSQNFAHLPYLSIQYKVPLNAHECCTSDGCFVITETQCATFPDSMYYVNSSTCVNGQCMAIDGACCQSNGDCSITSAQSCFSEKHGVSFIQNVEQCEISTCPRPSGACCSHSGECVIIESTQCEQNSGTYLGNDSKCLAGACPIPLDPFIDPLPIPQVERPQQPPPPPSDKAKKHYKMKIQQFRQVLHSQLPATTVWGYNRQYPGPTLEVDSNEIIKVVWENDLRRANGEYLRRHYLPVDTCLHGPNFWLDSPRVVTHVHGAHVPSKWDGHPDETILPGESIEYYYLNDQEATTLWYHDHALGITRLNVQLGLAGFYIIRDEIERSLNLPSGQFEVPLAIQDRSFNPDGSFAYPASWQDMFIGNKILVNGIVWPYMNVCQGKYRFRMLGASNDLEYIISLSNGANMTLIGTDGGLLGAPMQISSLTIFPAQRADIIIDFESESIGTEIIMNQGNEELPSRYIMKFIVSECSTTPFTDPVPTSLRPIERLLPEDASATHQMVLGKVTAERCGYVEWVINNEPWTNPTTFVKLGALEVWEFINPTGDVHPMHIHLVQFQVIDKTPGTYNNGTFTPTGPATMPPPIEQGWSDVVAVPSKNRVRVIAKFSDYAGPYPSHCHILSHEDQSMMMLFRVQENSCNQNGRCEKGEDCISCPSDCQVQSGAVCGNSLCEIADGEDCHNCPHDCNQGRDFCCGHPPTEISPLPPPVRYLNCTDTRCLGGQWYCRDTPALSVCCGDNWCQGHETIENCSIDCNNPLKPLNEQKQLVRIH